MKNAQDISVTTILRPPQRELRRPNERPARPKDDFAAGPDLNPVRWAYLLAYACSTFALLSAASSAIAQNPQVTTVWPPGGMRGTKVAARIEGSNLSAVSTVVVAGRGVSVQMGAPAKDGNSLPLALDLASDAQPGPYEIRAISPKGMSNPGYVWVGALKEIEEKEPNDQPEKAMRLDSLPITVNGRVQAPEDVDWYGFHADANDTFVFDIVSNRLYAPLDPFLELRDAEGHLLGSAMEGYDRDPRLVYTFKKPGEYRLHVRDTEYRGGPGFVYKLTMGKVPLITGLTPPGGKRGETLAAAVDGVNLGSLKTVSIPLPADLPEERAHYMIVDTPTGPSLPFAVTGDDYAQAAAGASAPPIRLADRPITLNGVLLTSRAKGGCRLLFEAGKPVQIAVAARSFGSRVMGYLRIVDASGKEMLNTEDQIGRDPQVTFSAPAAGEYRIELTTIDNRGGPEYPYRIILRPSVFSDFRASVSSDNIVLGKGQTAVLNVSAERLGGFNGEVAVHVNGAPAGVAVSPLTLRPGQNAGIVTLTATGPNLVNGALTVSADALVGGKRLEHPVQVLGDLPRPGEGQIVPRPVQFQRVSTTDAVPLFTLTPDSTAVTLTPGQTITLKIKASRRPNDGGANGAIALTLADLPPGVSAETSNIQEKQNETTIKLTAAANAAPATGSSLLTGKIGDNNTEPAPAIVITVKGKG